MTDDACFVAHWEPAPAIDPIGLWAALRDAGEDGSFLATPADGSVQLAFGRVHALASPDVASIAAELRTIAVRRHPASATPPGPDACWFGSSAFDPDAPRLLGAWDGLDPISFVLPRFVVWQEGGRSWLGTFGHDDEGCAAQLADARARIADAAAVQARDAAEAEPAPRGRAAFRLEAGETPEAYAARVDAAVDAFGARQLHKIVLARDVAVQRPGGFSSTRIVRRLRSAFPDCTSYAVRRGGASFVGATPERLLVVRGDRLVTSALAGSAPRGRSPEEDAALAQGLLESKKDQEEHGFVVAAIREALGDACVALQAPDAPEVMRIDGIQHLHTPFEGQLRAGVGAADVLAMLHPTPAVGGAPRAAALDFLRAHEPLERGWYAGPVGWLGNDGSGALAVALRCALLRDDRATLFAGGRDRAGLDRHPRARGDAAQAAAAPRRCDRGLAVAADGPAGSANQRFAEALFAALHDVGVGDCCICPGSRSTPLVTASLATPMRRYVRLDERSAAFFALGIAKARRAPGRARLHERDRGGALPAGVDRGAPRGRSARRPECRPTSGAARFRAPRRRSTS